MKHLYLSLTFVVFLINAHISIAQGVNYINQSSEWRYVHNGADGINTYERYFTSYFDGIEIINGTSYFKEYKLYYTTTHWWYGATTIDTNLYGPRYIREDLNGNFYEADILNNTEYLVLDNQLIANVQIGDPFPLSLSTVCPVQNIDTLYLGSTALKKINGNYLASNAGTLEGVGLIYPTCELPIEGAPSLVCYKKDSFEIQFQAIDCNLFPNPERVNLNVGISNKNFDKDYNVYPNPSNGSVFITNKGSDASKITISSLEGKTVFSSELTKNSEKSMLQLDLENGVYLLTILDDLDQLIFTKRIVIL
jgi:Secretion system C-terminal sorting domain